MKIFLIFFSMIMFQKVFCCETFLTCSKKPDKDAKATLFVDLNNSPTEINCSRKAACEKGEIFIVFPGSDASVTTANFSAKFIEQIKTLDTNATDVETLVLSGHDGGSSFGGVKGQLHYNQIQKAFDSYPKVKDGIKNYFGWGCYTATLNEVDNKMLQLFPNLDLIMGYDLKAPLSEREAGYSFLYAALKAKDKLQASKDLAHLKTQLKALDQFQNLNLAGYVRSIQCTDENGVKVYNPSDEGFYFWKEEDGVLKSVKLEEAKELCRNKIEETKIQVSIFNKTVLGEIPGEGHGDGTELRRFYNNLRLIEGCLTKEQSKSFPSAHSVLLLIFDDYAMRKFFKGYKDELQKLKDLIQKEYPGKNFESFIPKESDLKDPLYRAKFADGIFNLNKGIIQDMTQKSKKDFSKEESKNYKQKILSLEPAKKEIAMAIDMMQDMLLGLRLPVAWALDEKASEIEETLFAPEIPAGAQRYNSTGEPVEQPVQGGGPTNLEEEPSE